MLATRRLVRLVSEDKITEGPRAKVASLHPSLAYLVTCRACTSVWAAAAVTLAPTPIRWVLAASEGAIITGALSKMVERVAL